ncbi:transmembrane protein C1orf162 homolog isoform X2 [Phacochoerus africanus]|uniref:transmembrane protein C1orf162 homolog isoform X2 n=1 Tax=Phacochoerus africanus TaxID=41426 RepID=UPI001FD877F7|nr:transmembrane protein C1orf162 homolog isoform X2 [Phacochoerus africanus]XP_047640979.1 transmembrane protein C1orf162 homolog isoform X2 [Phacochoerus africanus]XP_047640980.1 transmembrane protein C1orf162 homolog isoform X2 [Phacochoerus africanus]
MGSGGSKSEPNKTGQKVPPTTTTTTTTTAAAAAAATTTAAPRPPTFRAPLQFTSTPFLSGHPNKEHLVLAFFAGVVLTLLLLALIFLVMKSYRKCRASPRAPDPPSDPPAECAPPEEALTYANMTFKISKEKRDHLTMSHSADSDPVVYAQIKETNSPCLSGEA